jgi:hypothetical protein
VPRVKRWQLGPRAQPLPHPCPQPSPAHDPYPTLTIPTPRMRIASYNANGLSGGATDGASKARQPASSKRPGTGSILPVPRPPGHALPRLFPRLQLLPSHHPHHLPQPQTRLPPLRWQLVPKSLSKRWTSALGTRTPRASSCSMYTSNPTTKPSLFPPFPPSRTPRKASPTSSRSATGYDAAPLGLIRRQDHFASTPALRKDSRTRWTNSTSLRSTRAQALYQSVKLVSGICNFSHF